MKHLEQLFENQFDCYADMNDESVVLAMTKEQFVKVVRKVVHQALDEAAERACVKIEIVNALTAPSFKVDKQSILSLKEKY